MAYIVVADDNPDMRLELVNTLSTLHTVVATAENGAQLVEMALQYSPEVIVTDVWMPVLDGISALKEVAQHGLRIPSVVVSLEPTPDVADYIAAGSECVFVHKINLATELMAAVEQLLVSGIAPQRAA